MKKFLAIVLAALMLLSIAACTGNNTPVTPDEPEVIEEGKVFNIYCWNTEYKRFFDKYITGEAGLNDNGTPDDYSDDSDFWDGAIGVPEGVTVNWVINPSDGGVYQQKLDEALLNQDSAPADEKIDMFLAEADYILKYVESDYTAGIDTIGFTNPDTMYDYTIDACTDMATGVVKGMSF